MFDSNAKIVILELGWLEKLMDEEDMDNFHLSELIELLTAVPEIFEEYRDEILIKEIDFDEELAEIVMRLDEALKKSLTSFGLDPSRFMFLRWLDKKTIVMIEAKCIFDWA